MTKPFKVEISEESLQNIYSKVKNYQWHEMPVGGHFAALEQSDFLIKDIRDFTSTL